MLCDREATTAPASSRSLPLPLDARPRVLPLVGLTLNGTSSVLYGTVPELGGIGAPRARLPRCSTPAPPAAGAVAPVIYGALQQHHGMPTMMVLIAAVALLTLPLVWALRSALPEHRPTM